MAHSVNKFTYNGTNTFDLSFSGGYRVRQNVTAYKDGPVRSPLAFDWITPNRVTIIPAEVSIGDTVVFERTVSKESLPIDLMQPGNFTREAVEAAAKHTLEALQEVLDGRVDSFNGVLIDTLEEYAARGEAVVEIAEDVRESVIDIQGATLFAGSVVSLMQNTRTSYPNGTVFMTRREGYSYEVVSSNPDVTTTGGVGLRVLPKSNGAVSPEQFGAVGSEPFDDTAAFRRMLSGQCRTFDPDPSKVYLISGQLDFGRESTITNKLRFVVRSQANTGNIIPGVQTGGSAEHRTLLVFQGKHKGSGVEVLYYPTATNPWRAIVGNDYFLHGTGTRPSHITDVDLGDIVIKSTEWVDGYTGDHNGALRFQGINRLVTGNVEISNFAMACRITDVTTCLHGDFKFDQARMGCQWTRCEWVVSGELDFKGSVSNRVYAPGNNAYVIRGCLKFIGGSAVIKDSGEHGIRITSLFSTGGTGIYGRACYSDVSQGDISVYRPGGCGYKADSGSANDERAPIKSVSIGNLYVEDAGTEQYAVGGGFAGSNHFGLNLQYCNSFSCTNYWTRKIANAHNGENGILIRNSRNINIPKGVIEHCYGDGIFWNVGDDDVYYNIDIKVTVRDFGAKNSSSSSARIINPNQAGNVNLDLNAYNGPRLVTMQDVLNNPPAPWYIQAKHYNLSSSSTVIGLGTFYNGYNVSVKSGRSPTSSGELNFDVTAILLCRGNGSAFATLRNGEVDVYLSNDGSAEYYAVNAGADVSALNVGTRLSGTWRSRGQVVLDRSVLAQRVN